MTRYRAGVIGLGWMGLLYDLAERVGDRDNAFSVDDIDRPTPDLDVHRRIHHHEHPGDEGLPSSYAEALWDRPEVDMVAGADRDRKRLKAFRERYGVDAVYTDAEEMLRRERLDIVAIATNVKGRADLTNLAVECGAKGIMTEKPMAHSLEEADRMVGTCADNGVPLCCGAITTCHPSFGRAKELVRDGAIGDILSIEATVLTPYGGTIGCAQHQNWTYFVDSAPAWVAGFGDMERRESGSDEFVGQGMMVTTDGNVVHFRQGAPLLRITGREGEMVFRCRPTAWSLWWDIETPAGRRRTQVPWPGLQMVNEAHGVVYGLADIFDCLEGLLNEPKNSGRRVAMAIEVEIALKQSSARGGVRVDLPLSDRSLGLNYASYR